MSAKTKYVWCNILDFVFTYGGSAGLIVLNYVSANSSKYKLTITGIMLVVAMVFTCKHIFEKSYRAKMDMYLQALASTTDADEKKEINDNIDSLKMKNSIYNRVIILMPFMILYIVSYLGEIELHNLRYTTGLLLATLGIGGVFNVIKTPYYEQAQLDKIRKKVLKKKNN